MLTDSRTYALSGTARYTYEARVGAAEAPSSSSQHPTNRRESIGYVFRADAHVPDCAAEIDETISFDGDPFWDELRVTMARRWAAEDPDGHIV